MTQQCEDRVQAIAELIRTEQYAIDPAAVADALLRYVRWDDVPCINGALRQAALRPSRA